MPYFTLSSAAAEEIIVIDDTFKNLEFRGRNTFSTQGVLPAIQGALVYADIQVGGVDPLVCIASATGCVMLSRSQSGSPFTFRILFNSKTHIAFTYYVFDEPGSQLGELYFSVRNEQNQLVFNAANKYMRILGALNSDGTSTTVTFAGGKSAAVLLGVGGVRGDNTVGPAPNPQGWLASDGLRGSFARISGSTAFIDVVEFARNNWQGVYPDPPPYTESGNWGTSRANHLIVDVTGL